MKNLHPQLFVARSLHLGLGVCLLLAPLAPGMQLQDSEKPDGDPSNVGLPPGVCIPRDPTRMGHMMGPSGDTGYYNGDCTCGSFPRREGVDTDGDGSLDEVDDDDDCDHLSDALERLMQLNPLKAGSDSDGISDTFDLLPSQVGDLTLRVKITHITQLVKLDNCCTDGKWGDPYLDVAAGVSLLGDRTPPEQEHRIALDHLAHDDHYSDKETFTFEGFASVSLPSDFTSLAYANRDTPAEYPRIALQLPLWDDDGGESEDDDYGDLEQIVFNLLQAVLVRAGGAAGFPFANVPWNDGSRNTARVSGEVHVDASACALEWASLARAGKYTVYPSDLTNQAQDQKC